MCCPRGNLQGYIAQWPDNFCLQITNAIQAYFPVAKRQIRYISDLCAQAARTSDSFWLLFFSRSFFLCKCIVGNLCCFDSLSLCYNFQVCTGSCTDYCLDKRHGNIEVICVKWFIFQNKLSCNMKKKPIILLLITLFTLLFSLTEVCWIYYYNIFPKHIS